MFYVHKLNSLWTSFAPVFVDSFARLTCKNVQPSSRICPTFKISVKIGGLPPPRPVHSWPHPKLIFPHLPGECRYQAESSCIGWRGGLSLSNLVSSVNGWNKTMWKKLLNKVSFLFLYDFYVNKPSFGVTFHIKMKVKLTTQRSMYWEGGPPFLVLGPAGAVQIGKGTLVLP
jgi:hypothetical protein